MRHCWARTSEDRCQVAVLGYSRNVNRCALDPCISAETGHVHKLECPCCQALGPGRHTQALPHHHVVALRHGRHTEMCLWFYAALLELGSSTNYLCTGFSESLHISSEAGTGMLLPTGG